MKIALLIGGFLLVGIGAADLLLGNTDHPVLPAPLANNLTQQTDIVALGIGGGALWLAYTQL